jgi:GNAT superfamily N-acetyltransferase
VRSFNIGRVAEETEHYKVSPFLFRPISKLLSRRMIEIRTLTTAEQIRDSFEVMQQLRPHLFPETYLTQVMQQREHESYQLVGLFDEVGLRSLGGFRIMTNLVCGRIVYVDDLVSDQNSRSEGYGAQLLEWIAEYGRSQGCTQLHLDSGVQRHGAHRFYLRERMDIVYYHFKKDLLR